VQLPRLHTCMTCPTGHVPVGHFHAIIVTVTRTCREDDAITSEERLIRLACVTSNPRNVSSTARWQTGT
jgi:hypothetical protein